jgi:hypothetical protein
MAGPREPRKHLIVLGFISLWVGCSATWAQPLPALPAPLPVLARAAQTIGVRRCLSAITAIAGRTGQGATHQDVILDWDHRTPDAAAFFSLTGLEYGPLSAAFSLTTVPDATGGCSILAERISAAPIACRLVAQRELTGYTGTPLLSSITVYTNPRTPRETVTLVNSPPGCLIVRRQVEYGWRPAP